MLLNESYKLQLTMDLWSVPPTGVGVGGQQGQFTPGPQCKGHKNSTGLVQIPVRQSHSTLACLFHCILCTITCILHGYSLVPRLQCVGLGTRLIWLLRSSLASNLVLIKVVLFDLPETAIAKTVTCG